MKLPVKCPHCGDVLLTEYNVHIVERNFITKVCERRTDHTLKFFSDNQDDVYKIRMTTSGLIHANVYCVFWRLTDKDILVIPGAKNIIYDGNNALAAPGAKNLPFFEPDLTNVHKLADRIKTYLVFS